MLSSSYLIFSLINSLSCVFVGWLLNTLSQTKRDSQKYVENNLKKISLLCHKLSRVPRVLLAICNHHNEFMSAEGILAENKYINTILCEHIDSVREILFFLKLEKMDLLLKLTDLEHYIDFSYRLAKIGRIEKPKTISIEETNKESFYKNILKDFSVHNNNFMTYNEALSIFIDFFILEINEFINSYDSK